MTKFISILSGKGGVGKTTTATNLGYALTKLGRDVIVLDANFTTPNLNLHLGAVNLPTTFHDVVQGKTDITNAIYQHKSGIKVIPASMSLKHLKELDFKAARDALSKLKGLTDIVIVDGAAGLGDESVIMLEAADEVLIIANPEITSVSGAVRTVKVANEMKKVVLGVVLTRVRGDKLEMKDADIEKVLELPIIAKIPYHKEVKQSIIRKHPATYIYPENKASKEYFNLAQKLLGAKFNSDIEPNIFYGFLRKIGIRIERGRQAP
ncbi:MAG: cell division ATPase MinD [Nanoarchaeota archaeon]|nr:cell division ATPase MinD [Nanoarchaeota archaeon]